MGKAAYPTAADLEAYLEGAGYTVTGLDLATAAEAGRLAFERSTGRKMLADALASTRGFNPPLNDASYVPIDELAVAPTAVAFQPLGGTSTPLTLDTDYQLEPPNASAIGHPYVGLRLGSPSLSPLRFTSHGAIRVTGRWGYGVTIPEDAWLAMVELGARTLMPQLQQTLVAGGVKRERQGTMEVEYFGSTGGASSGLSGGGVDVASVIRRYRRMTF